MIYYPLSQFTRSREVAKAAAAVLSADGQAIVNKFTNGVHGADVSAGTAGEVFLGFLATQTSAASFLQTTAVKVQDFVVPAGKTLTLDRTPIASTTVVINKATGAALTPDSVTGNVVDLTTAGVAGMEVTVVYRYNLTVLESKSLNGDVTPGGYSGYTTGTLSLVEAGTIYTDQFNTALTWNANAPVTLGANGLLTQGGTGTVLRAAIVGLPSVDSPWLGLEFDAF